MSITLRAKNQGIAKAAITELEAARPMTMRQLYYRLISAGKLRNAQPEYKRLVNLMTRLREAGRVPRTWIVDHIRTTLKPSSWSGLSDFGETVRRCYRKDYWASLDTYVAVFVEKDAVAGVIQPITHEYDVALHVCRGYASISFVGEIADDWREIGKPIAAYYVGDFDPSGFDIERDLCEKLERYSGLEIGVNVQWRRLAVKPSDFDEFNLIRLPVKHADRRAAGFLERWGNHAAEVDALPPSELRRRVRHAILDHIDTDKWERLQAAEKIERAAMQEAVSAWRTPEMNLGQLSEEAAG